MVERTNNARPTTLNPTRRFTVRLALATGATVATLIGAQQLALLERPVDTAHAQENATTVSPTSLKPTDSAPTAANTAISTSVPPAAPRLIVIRNQGALPTPGQTVKPVRPSSQTARPAPPASVNGGIAPPVAVVDQAPAVQAGPSGGGGGQPAPATHSSR